MNNRLLLALLALSALLAVAARETRGDLKAEDEEEDLALLAVTHMQQKKCGRQAHGSIVRKRRCEMCRCKNGRVTCWRLGCGRSPRCGAGQKKVTERRKNGCPGCPRCVRMNKEKAPAALNRRIAMKKLTAEKRRKALAKIAAAKAKAALKARLAAAALKLKVFNVQCGKQPPEHNLVENYFDVVKLNCKDGNTSVVIEKGGVVEKLEATGAHFKNMYVGGTIKKLEATGARFNELKVTEGGHLKHLEARKSTAKSIVFRPGALKAGVVDVRDAELKGGLKFYNSVTNVTADKATIFKLDFKYSTVDSFRAVGAKINRATIFKSSVKILTATDAEFKLFLKVTDGSKVDMLDIKRSTFLDRPESALRVSPGTVTSLDQRGATFVWCRPGAVCHGARGGGNVELECGGWHDIFGDYGTVSFPDKSCDKNTYVFSKMGSSVDRFEGSGVSLKEFSVDGRIKNIDISKAHINGPLSISDRASVDAMDMTGLKYSFYNIYIRNVHKNLTGLETVDFAHEKGIHSAVIRNTALKKSFSELDNIMAKLNNGGMNAFTIADNQNMAPATFNETGLFCKSDGTPRTKKIMNFNVEGTNLQGGIPPCFSNMTFNFEVNFANNPLHPEACIDFAKNLRFFSSAGVLEECELPEAEWANMALMKGSMGESSLKKMLSTDNSAAKTVTDVVLKMYENQKSGTMEDRNMVNDQAKEAGMDDPYGKGMQILLQLVSTGSLDPKKLLADVQVKWTSSSADLYEKEKKEILANKTADDIGKITSAQMLKGVVRVLKNRLEKSRSRIKRIRKNTSEKEKSQLKKHEAAVAGFDKKIKQINEKLVDKEAKLAKQSGEIKALSEKLGKIMSCFDENDYYDYDRCSDVSSDEYEYYDDDRRRLQHESKEAELSTAELEAERRDTCASMNLEVAKDPTVPADASMCEQVDHLGEQVSSCELACMRMLSPALSITSFEAPEIDEGPAEDSADIDSTSLLLEESARVGVLDSKPREMCSYQPGTGVHIEVTGKDVTVHHLSGGELDGWKKAMLRFYEAYLFPFLSISCQVKRGFYLFDESKTETKRFRLHDQDGDQDRDPQDQAKEACMHITQGRSEEFEAISEQNGESWDKVIAFCQSISPDGRRRLQEPRDSTTPPGTEDLGDFRSVLTHISSIAHPLKAYAPMWMWSNLDLDERQDTALLHNGDGDKIYFAVKDAKRESRKWRTAGAPWMSRVRPGNCADKSLVIRAECNSPDCKGLFSGESIQTAMSLELLLTCQ